MCKTSFSASVKVDLIEIPDSVAEGSFDMSLGRRYTPPAAYQCVLKILSGKRDWLREGSMCLLLKRKVTIDQCAV